MTSALLSLALAFTGQNGVSQGQVTPTLQDGLSYAEVNRLALTPKIDGILENEEWEALATTNGVESFFEWEPGKLHVAAKTAVGQDLLVSLDLSANGWFAGEDNLEIQVKWNGAAPESTVRKLINTPDMGPTWVEAPDYKAAMVLAATGDGTNWVCEMTIVDPAVKYIPSLPGSKVGVRVEGVASTNPPLEPHLPRSVPPVNLVWERSTNVPTGLRWKTEYRGRSVMPGEAFRIRFAFDGAENLGLKRIDMRTEGLGKDFTSSQGIPFPNFDRKLRAIVDYNANVTSGAPLGWRIARATIFDSQDRPTILQTSFEVSAPVTFDFNDTNVKASTEQQTVRLSAYIRSNTVRRVTGIFRVIPPLGWAVESGSEKSFTLATPRASKRQSFALKVPAGYKGTAPFKLIAEMGEYRQEQSFWLVIQ